MKSRKASTDNAVAAEATIVSGSGHLRKQVYSAEGRCTEQTDPEVLETLSS